MKKLYTLILFSLAVITASAQNPWIQKANFGGTPRSGAAGFVIGTKGYIGTGNGQTDLWEWNQSTNVWTQKASQGGFGFHDPVGFSIGTKGYIGTGTAGTNVTNAYLVYDQPTNTWGSNYQFFGGGNRDNAVGFSIGTKGYISTGQDFINSTWYKDFWEFNQSTGTWTQKANFGGTARFNAAGFSIGTKGYIGTGQDATGYKSDFWEWDQATNVWTQKANFGGGTMSAGTGFSIGTKGYIGTGSVAGGKGFYQWDQATNTWKKGTDFAGTGRSNAVGFAIGTKGYIGTASGTNPDDFWEYDPSQDCKLIVSSGFTASSYTVNTGSAVTFTNSSTGASSYNWLNNGVSFSTSTNAAYTYTAVGTYTVSLVAINGGCSDTISQLITVYCVISNFQTSANNITEEDTVNFTNTSSYAISYTWLNNGVPFSTSLNASYTYSVAGTYTVSLVASNATCSDTTQIIITVNPCQKWILKANYNGGPSGYGAQSAIGFSIGNKGYIGTGFNFSSAQGSKDIWEWNQGTNVWTQKANYGGGKRQESFSFSIGTKGYVGTGNDSLGYRSRDFWEYDPSTNTWAQKADYPGGSQGGYIAFGVGFSIGSKGYAGLGKNVSSVMQKDFWEYDPSTNIWTQKTNFGGSAREDAVGFSIGTKGYVGTGYDNSINTNDWWEYNPSTDSWVQKANFPGTGTSSAVGFSIATNGKGYLGMGNSSNFYEYDPITDTWTQMQNYAGGTTFRAVGFSIGKKGYVGIGNIFYEFDPDTCGQSVTTNVNSSPTLKEESINIFPNPSTGHFTLQSSIQKGEITIYNVQGEKVYSTKINSSQLEIDLSKERKGIYFIKLISEQGTATKKLIIQ